MTRRPPDVSDPRLARRHRRDRMPQDRPSAAPIAQPRASSLRSSRSARSTPVAGAVTSPSAAPAAGSITVTCRSVSSHSALRLVASDATGEGVGELTGPAPLPAIATALKARPLPRITRGVAPSLAARRPRGPVARGVLPVADLTCTGSPGPNASSAARNRSTCSESSATWRSMLIRSSSILTIMEE